MERIPHHLHQADDEAAQGHIAAFGETLDLLPLLAPKALQPQLREAAIAFERATRSRVHARHHHGRALRAAVRTMLREPASGDGAGLAMLLDAAILTVIAAARWHQLRRHDQQVASAHRTLVHLQAAYDQAAASPLAALAQRPLSPQTVDRTTRHLRQALPAHIEQVLRDPAFDALTAALAEAEAAGHNAEQLLHRAVDQRALDDARHPARVLIWRVRRLSAARMPNRPAAVPAAQPSNARRR